MLKRRVADDGLVNDYYQATAAKYDALQILEGDEHSTALSYLSGIIMTEQPRSLLDVGCGTGRALSHIQRNFPGIALAGIDTSSEMLTICEQKGLSKENLFAGDACELPFETDSFDCVTAFGILHHIQTPERAIAELCRVARSSVFVSDHNVYGWGGKSTRLLKSSIKNIGLWPLFRLLHTGGKGYYDTDYDGIFYPFSLLDHVSLFEDAFPHVRYMTTKAYGPKLYSATSHLCIHAAKI